MKKFQLPVWVLAWLVVVLGALVVLFANQSAVDRLLAATGLEKLLYPRGKSALALEVSPTPGPSVPTETLVPPPSPEPLGLAGGDPGPDVVQAPAQDLTETSPVPLPQTPNTFRLYFLKLSPEGRMDPVGFPRELPAGTTPLSATLKSLLQGPTLQDKAQGALSGSGCSRRCPR